MKAIFLALSLMIPLQAKAADQMNFSCWLYGQVPVQGAERYVKVQIAGKERADLFISDMASPYEHINSNLSFHRSHYSHNDSSAFAAWKDQSGNEVVNVSLVFLGGWWGAHVSFTQEVNTKSLRFAQGETIELFCKEEKQPSH